MPKYRTVHLEDAPSFAILDAKCFPPEIAYNETYFQELIQSAEVAGIVEEYDNGVLAGFILWSDAREGIGHLITIDVLPDLQGQGIGDGLMKGMHDACRKNGTRAVVLEVSVSNLRAIRFYERIGYSQVTHLEDYYGEGKHAHLMMIRI